MLTQSSYLPPDYICIIGDARILGRNDVMLCSRTCLCLRHFPLWSKGKYQYLWCRERQHDFLTPTICLQQTEDRMYLCVYQYKNLTLILLVPVSSILTGEQGAFQVKKQVENDEQQSIGTENVALMLQSCSERLFPTERKELQRRKCSKGFGRLAGRLQQGEEVRPRNR